jgi:hypothetical protein
MSNNLDNLIYIFSVDTSAFYNDVESNLDKRLLKNKVHKSKISSLIKPLSKLMEKHNKLIGLDEHNEKHPYLLLEVEKLKNNIHRMTKFKEKMDSYLLLDEETKLYKVNKDSKLYKFNKSVDGRISRIKKKLDDEAMKHTDIRNLREVSLKSSNKITQFESNLTRTLGVNKDETTTDILVVRAYRYVIFEQLMTNGFEYLGERYQYFTSSAGQIRQKKSLWIKSKVYDKIKNKLMCGLSIEYINAKEGMNLNKFNAYTALCNTASTPWTDFDITKAIVVPDFSTIINAEVDYIDSRTYEITRQMMDVEINHVDGSGIYLPSPNERNKSFQFRMPFFKGLMIPFDYVKFIKQFNGNPIIKDIYGKEHNVIEKGIKYILTKSQFKMHKFFESWVNYQESFEQYECEAVKCKEEVEVFDDKPISYQVLQTLNHMTKEELTKISQCTIDIIENVGKDIDVMMKILGADKSNENKRGLEKALGIYPNLLNDDYSKEVIKEKKRSLVKSARAGKLLIPNTKRTYIAPDLFAFAERLFLGVENPNGLLNDGEVSCSLYGDGQKLDVLRSPHLFREHCCRKNKLGKIKRITEDGEKEINISDWFISKNIYTSVKDLISKQLMFDVDGDDALCVSNPDFVRVAEEHMLGIIPLQYELGVAKQELINNRNIYKGLTSAYSKNIGEISNDISKIWANEKPDLDTIKRLVFENNACIDFAKSLWYPERPLHINKIIKGYTKNKVPHFFRFAKDKKKDQVAAINNSVVNMLVTEKIIPDKRIHFEDVIEGFDYKKLMKNPRTNVDDEIIEVFEKINKSKHWDIKKQVKENGSSRRESELAVYKEFRNELLKYRKRQFVVDVLIKYLYAEKKTENKQSLWYMFGDDIVRNLQFNIQGIVECVDCKKEVEVVRKQQVRCDDCHRKYVNEKSRLRVQKQRMLRRIT